MNELKPCPFCGGEAKIITYADDDKSIKCGKCWAGTSRYMSVERAVFAWNTRAHSECYLDSPCEYQNEDTRMGKEVESDD